VSTLIAGHWLPSNKFDPRAIAIYLRHYSALFNNGKSRARVHKGGFAGNGETLVLLTERCDALFSWIYKPVTAAHPWGRKDNQEGVNCNVFRNEGLTLSSELIAEADDLAWQRWPDVPRHFTYVCDSLIRSVNPGYCFKQAGWRTCGRNKDGRLSILERLP
jgi:hypothetical protein